MKYILDEKLIARLKNNEICIDNTNTNESNGELIKAILVAAFPNDVASKNASIDLNYYYSTGGSRYWSHKTTQPSHLFPYKPTEFVKKTIGDNDIKMLVGYKLIDEKYEHAANALLANRQAFITWNQAKTNLGYYSTENDKELLLDFDDAGVLKIWFEPVYDYVKSLPKINGYTGVINGLYVEYGCAKFLKHNLINLYNSLVAFNDSSNTRTIDSVTLSSHVSISFKQLGDIIEFLNSK